MDEYYNKKYFDEMMNRSQKKGFCKGVIFTVIINIIVIVGYYIYINFYYPYI